MNQETKIELAKRVKEFCLKELGLSIEDTYKVISRAQYEIWKEKVKIKKVEKVNSESKEEVKNWLKI